MRGKLKRILTDKTKFAILAFLAVMMIIGIGMQGDADAYVAGDVIYINAAASTYAPGSGTNFTVTVTLTDFAGNGVAGKAGDGGTNDGVYLNKVTDVNKANPTTTFPLADGTVWTDNGDGTYTISGSITDTGNAPYNMEVRFDDPTNANYRMKAYIMLTVGGTASSADMGIMDSAPDFTYYPFDTGTVTMKVRLKNQDGSAHTTATVDTTSNGGCDDCLYVNKVFDVTNKGNVTYTTGTAVNNGDGTYDVPINYSAAPTDNEIYLVEVRYEWDGATNNNVRHGTNFAFEINSTQAPAAPAGAPPSNPGCAECTPAAGPPLVSGTTLSATDSGTQVDSPFHANAVFDGSADAVTSCEYCVATDGTCDTEWAAATLTGGATATANCDADPTCTDTNTLTINMRATNTGGTVEATVASRTCDASAPTTSDDQASSAWQNTEKTVTLTPNDGTGAGVTAATGIYGCFGAVCSPLLLGSNNMTTACGAGSACTYDVLYYSIDDVGNTETTVTSGFQAQIDRANPVDGATASGTPGNNMVDLSWDAGSDVGSGLDLANTYKIVKTTGVTAPADCTGAALATTSLLTYSDTTAVNGTTYSYRICAQDNVANLSTGLVVENQTPVSGPVFTITSCSGCHTLPPTDGARNASTGAVVGSHSVADHLGATCTNCHIDNGTAASAYPQGLGHREGLIELLTTIHGQAGSSYSKGTSFAQSDAPTLGTCATTLCHGTSSPTWGTDLSASGLCVKCHGEAGVASPTDAQKAPGGAGVDTGGASATTDPQVGMHQTHLNASNSYSSPIPCSECHSIYTAPSDAGHWDAAAPWDGAATMNWGASATGSLEGPGTTPSFDSGGTLQCSNVYCHDGKYFKNANGTASASGADPTPVWTNSGYLNGTPSLAADCGQCHDAPPANAIVSSHSGSEVLADCTTCHGHFNADGTLNQPELHVNGLVEGAGDCIVCHDTGGAGTTGPNNRDAVMTEFGLAWGHKKTGRGAVTNSDCIVCHLEGDFASQSPSAYHNDGNIDLRDPDGAGETPITNIAGGAWTFTSFLTAYGATDRTTTGHTAETVDNILTQKFCLACHDSDGATNTTARTPGGTANMPFGGVNLGGNYTIANGAVAAGGLIDVKTQVDSLTSSSYHPMTSPRNAGYPTTGLMVSPYDNFTRTGGTLADSVVLNCFDCHNSPTPLTTRTTAAHGSSAANSMRGAPTVQTAGDSNPNASTGSTLCFVCHNPSSGAESHDAGSGFTTNGRSPMSTFLQFGCNMCHGNGYSAGQTPARPVRAQNVHGFPSTVSGPVTTKRAFFRGNTTDAYITDFFPGSCTGMGGTICAGARTKTYTPGGVY